MSLKSTGPFFSLAVKLNTHCSMLNRSRVIERNTRPGSSSSCVCRARMRSSARTSPSSDNPVSSTACGGSGYSSGSLEKICIAARSNSFIRPALSLYSLYSSSLRMSACSGVSSPSSVGSGGRGKSARDLISSSVAAIVKNSLAVSISSSSTLPIDARYCSVISETKISLISTFALVIKWSSRSSGPSNCLRET